jgi:hypothetical protein
VGLPIPLCSEIVGLSCPFFSLASWYASSLVRSESNIFAKDAETLFSVNLTTLISFSRGPSLMDKISPALMFLEGLMGFPPSFTWFLWHASVARVRVLNILVAHNHRSTLTASNSSSGILFLEKIKESRVNLRLYSRLEKLAFNRDRTIFFSTRINGGEFQNKGVLSREGQITCRSR